MDNKPHHSEGKKKPNRFVKSVKYVISQAKSGSKPHIAIVVGIVLVAVLIVVLGISAVVKTSGIQGGNSVSVDLEADKNYNKDEEALDVDQLGNTILEQTQDAGQKYIDETLFIGDSNTVRTMLYGHTTWDNVVAATSMGVQHIQNLKMVYFKGYKDPVTVPQAVKIIQPQRIIITYGTNNTIGWDTETFLSQYQDGLKAIKKSYPYAEIIINSIPPIDKERENLAVTMQTIDKFNKALADMAKAEGYKFLNSSQVLKDEKTGFAKKDYTLGDGVHLNKAGMQAMFDYIRTHAYITKDTRPKPLTKVPKRDETPTGIISQDPLAVRGARVRLLFTSSDTELGKIEGEIEQKIKRTLTSDTVTAVPNLENGGIFTGWTSNQSGLSSASDQSVKFTVPKLGDDVNEVSIVANFKKAAITIKHNSDVKTAITLEKSAGISLVAEVSPEFTGDKKLTWQSDDSSIVTVDANGNVKAVSGGVTKVYASILGGKIYSSCTVTVNQALESISIKGDGNVKTGGTVQLTLALNPTGANVDKNTAVWSSGDDTVASVSSSGLVTAHNKDGTAVITCTLGGKTAQHTIKVSAPKPITGISITGPQTVFEGLSIQLAVAYAPADTTDPKTALWTSDNTSVASVVDGTVTGIAQGTANITCTVGSHTAKVSITVTQEKNYVHSVSISSTHIDIAVGASSPLSASAVLAYPQRPDGVDVTQHWASASGYINISGGVITVKEGLTSPSGTLSDTVTVTIGGKTNSCTVTITGVTVPQGENTEGGTPTPEITPSPAA